LCPFCSPHSNDKVDKATARIFFVWQQSILTNPPPDRLLQRIGFPLISTRIGKSSELSTVCKLNRYDIMREIAEDYLLTHQQARGLKEP
jgi:hypothetical protein